MKALHINSFLESTTYIFGQFQLSCELGKPTLRDTPFTGKDILTLVGVTGEIQGQIYMGIPKASALEIVSKMMGGYPVSGFDSMAQSALCELSNMICGNAMTLLSNQGILLDITPPSLIFGNMIEVSAVKMQVLSIPILFKDMESLEMNLVLKDRN